MALVAFDGSFCVPLGPGLLQPSSLPTSNTAALDATNEAVIYIGRITTSDGGSHTIDTTGSSSIGWRTSTVTFANGGTTVKVGIGSVLTTAGPPARANHASDVITFDVSKSMTGGGGGVTTDAWQSHVPDTGSKTIAHGDLVAVSIQMTARAGVDAVIVTAGAASTTSPHRPAFSSFVGGSYTAQGGQPNVLITFSDGAFGWFQGTDVFSAINTRTWNSGSATKEYGQLYSLPVPAKIYGIWGWIDPDNDCDVVLYSDPLGTPVAERTASMDANVMQSTTGRKFFELFSSPYTTTADQLFGVVFKPGGANVSAYYKTLNSATHRVTDIWGTDGYGISRASGAFGNANSSLDHYYIGPVIGAFDAGGSAGGGISRARAAAGF